MRTTITLDEDVAMAIRDVMTSTGATFKATVNELLRAAVRAHKQQPPAPRYVVRTYDTGGVVGGGDLAEAIRRMDESDAYELGASMHGESP